jgi:hypothetical protein
LQQSGKRALQEAQLWLYQYANIAAPLYNHRASVDVSCHACFLAVSQQSRVADCCPWRVAGGGTHVE